MKSAAISSPNHLPIMVAAALAVLAGTSICRSETLFTQSMPAAPSPILVDCTIEGSAKKLMFDTGASMIALNPEYEREKSAVIGKGTDHSGKEFTVPTGVGPTIEIQSLEITKPTCMFVDLSAAASQLGSDFAGILGMDPRIAEAKLYFDNEKSLLTAHSGDWLIDGKSEELSFKGPGNTPVFAAQILGHDIELIVDTGSTVSLTLPQVVFDELVEEKAIKKLDQTLSSQVAGGKVELEVGFFLKGELMGTELRGVEVLVGKDQGSIGLPWLKKFNFEISFADKQMRYRPAKSAE